MDQTQPTDQPPGDACPCCGVFVATAWLQAVWPAVECEVCIGHPFAAGPSCLNLHGDPLRLELISRVRAGRCTPLQAVAIAAADDAHRDGLLVVDGDTGAWCITVPNPDPRAWERIERMALTNDAIAVAMRECGTGVPAGTAGWNMDQVRVALLKRLSRLTRAVGCASTWSIRFVAGQGGQHRVDVEPPSDYILPDTVETRRARTLSLMRPATPPATPSPPTSGWSPQLVN